LFPESARERGLRHGYISLRSVSARPIDQLRFLARFDHLIDQPVVPRFRGRHVIIAVGIQPYLLLGSARMLRDDLDQALLQLEHVIDLALDVAGLSLRATGYLMDHDVRIRQGETFAFGSGTQQY